MSLARPCFLLAERAGAFGVDLDCMSGLSFPDHDGRLDCGTVITPVEVTGHIRCRCDRLFRGFRKSRLEWDLGPSVIVVTSLREDRRLCQKGRVCSRVLNLETASICGLWAVIPVLFGRHSTTRLHSLLEEL